MSPCPYCKREPNVERCEPWRSDAGPNSWFVGCYQSGALEHFIGVNGDNRADALRNWERKVANHEIDEIDGEVCETVTYALSDGMRVSFDCRYVREHGIEALMKSLGIAGMLLTGRVDVFQRVRRLEPFPPRLIR